MQNSKKKVWKICTPLQLKFPLVFLWYNIGAESLETENVLHKADMGQDTVPVFTRTDNIVWQN
jgi:hypothetical protein